MLLGEERAASVISAPTRTPQLPNCADTEAGRTQNVGGCVDIEGSGQRKTSVGRENRKTDGDCGRGQSATQG
jgi:hypothetical protein